MWHDLTDADFIELGEIWCCFYQIGCQLGYVCFVDPVESLRDGHGDVIRQDLQDGKIKDK